MEPDKENTVALRFQDTCTFGFCDKMPQQCIRWQCQRSVAKNLRQGMHQI
jgi:hypothetical protein